MKEISDYIYETLEADPTLRTYTGHSASDTRIFAEFPPEDLSAPYITFDVHTAGPIPDSEYVQPAQYEDQNVDINVFGSSADNRDNITERILELLKDHSFRTTNYKILRTILEYDDNITEIHETTGRIDSFRTYMRFRCSHIYKKLESEW